MNISPRLVRIIVDSPMRTVYALNVYRSI
jgi:hypothetical protein